MHITRYFMYERIRGAVCAPLTGKILGISGISKIGSLIDFEKSQIVEANYPDVDMQHMPYSVNEYDVVIGDQVIEHLLSPQKAVDECHRVLRPGGMAIITTCFINPLHPSPEDYWRFSPAGLSALFNSQGWEILECGGWGNRLALILIFLRDKFRFVDIVTPKSLFGRLAVWNEKKYPIVTWAVARKR